MKVAGNHLQNPFWVFCFNEHLTKACSCFGIPVVPLSTPTINNKIISNAKWWPRRANVRERTAFRMSHSSNDYVLSPTDACRNGYESTCTVGKCCQSFLPCLDVDVASIRFLIWPTRCEDKRLARAIELAEKPSFNRTSTMSVLIVRWFTAPHRSDSFMLHLLRFCRWMVECTGYFAG